MFNKFKDSEKIFDLLVKINISLVLFLIMFIATGFYINEPKVKEMVVLATTKKPETFTELYFENHLNLPSTANKEKEYSFEFTIHNLEYKEMNYPYEVYIETNGTKKYIEKKSVSLNHDNFVTIKQEFSVNEATRSAVVVNLINKNQEIRFWMEGEE